MNDLIIIGCGGLGRETAWTAERINSVKQSWNILGFIDDNPEMKGKTFDGYPVIGGCETATEHRNAYFICAVGRAAVRKIIFEKLKKILPEIKFATLIDPSAVICAERTRVGEGSIICGGTYITLDIVIGEHTYIGGNCTVGHDARLGEFTTLYPASSVSGNAQLGNCCELGTGARIIQGITVGENTIIGAGATVIRNLPENCTAVGTPAKPIKIHTKKV